MTTMKQVREMVESRLLQSTVTSAWLGYGDPLFLTFTEAHPARGDEPNEASAECKLDTSFATWSIEGPIVGNSERDDRDCLASAAQSLIGAVVHAVELTSDAVLTIRFDGSRSLVITPWPEEDEPSDAWSITLPEDKILAVSNAGQVVVVEKHLPIRDWFPDESL